QLKLTTIPSNIEEFYDLLVAFRDGDPNNNGLADDIPLSVRNPRQLDQVILSAFGLVRDGNNIGVLDDKAMYVPLEDNFKEYVTFVHRLYSEKLLDNEVFSHTSQQFTAKGKANQLGVFEHAAPFLVVDIAPEDSVGYPYLPPMLSAFNA